MKEFPAIEFNEKEHIYKVNGVIYPNVTTILENVGIIDFSKVKKSVLDFNMYIGTAVHKLCEFADKRILDYSKLDKFFLPYLENWEKFKKAYNVEFIEIEKRICSLKYFYAGTLDRVAKLNGELYILDIKTGMKLAWHGVQLAAYKQAYMELSKCSPSIKRMSIYLNDDKNFNPQKNIIEYKKKLDFDIFIHSLSICNYKKNN